MVKEYQYKELRKMVDHQLRYSTRNGTTCVCTDYLDNLLNAFVAQKEKIKELRNFIKEKSNA